MCLVWTFLILFGSIKKNPLQQFHLAREVAKWPISSTMLPLKYPSHVGRALPSPEWNGVGSERGDLGL